MKKMPLLALLLSLLTLPALASPGEVSCGEKNDVVLASRDGGVVNIRVTGLVQVSDQAELTVEYGAEVILCPYPQKEIEELHFNENVTGVADGVFRGCPHLAALVMGEDMASLGANAFADCTALKHVDLTTGLTTLGDGAFSGCTALTEVTLADEMSLETVGEGVFSGCPIQKVTAGESWRTDGAKQAQLAKLFPDYDLSQVKYAGDGPGLPVIVGCAAAAVVAVVVIVAVVRRRLDDDEI